MVYVEQPKLQQQQQQYQQKFFNRSSNRRSSYRCSYMDKDNYGQSSYNYNKSYSSDNDSGGCGSHQSGCSDGGWQDSGFSRSKNSMKMASVQNNNVEIVQSEADKIVKLQAVDGSWNDPTLIDRFAINLNKLHELANNTDSLLVITKLVVLWLQKYYPQKQYSLIIKKALAWIKKTQTEKGISEEKFYNVEWVQKIKKWNNLA